MGQYCSVGEKIKYPNVGGQRETTFLTLSVSGKKCPESLVSGGKLPGIIGQWKNWTALFVIGRKLPDIIGKWEVKMP